MEDEKAGGRGRVNNKINKIKKEEEKQVEDGDLLELEFMAGYRLWR